jgi:hypothetical protein
MTPKPAYDRLYELIHKQWWSDSTSTTDKQGDCHARVFYGDYLITVTAPGGLGAKLSTELDSSLPSKSLSIKLY